MNADRHAIARRAVLVALRSAVRHLDGNLEADDHPMVDGSWLTIRNGEGQLLCVVDARFPDEDPFDDVIRDRLRTVVARMQAPFGMICTLRRAIVFDASAMMRRDSEEAQVTAQALLADIVDVDGTGDAELHAHLETALRSVIRHIQPSDYVESRPCPEEFFEERLRQITSELLACTDQSSDQRQAVVRLATSVLAYGLIQMRNEETLDALHIPYKLRSSRLMLDVVGAYFRSARLQGHSVFPASVEDVRVVPHRTSIFRMALADLCGFVQRFDPARLDDMALHRAVDAYLQWCSGTQRVAAPVIDLVDVALRIAMPPTAAHNAPLLLELGAANGLFSIRSMVLADSGAGRAPQAFVYAPTGDDERHLVLRTAGQIDDTAGLHILRRRLSTDEAWSVVCVASTDNAERHRIRLLLQRLNVADNGAVVLVVPMAALYSTLWAGVRNALAEKFDVEWIITSDNHPLAHPDVGVCCIIAKANGDSALSEPTMCRTVVLRKAFDSFFLPCDVPRERDAKRVTGIDTFVRYLSASAKGKNNDEACVRVIPQNALGASASADLGWYPLVVPVDVLVRVMQKSKGKLDVLASAGTVVNGLRTGANEFFLLDANDIAAEALEPQYWQRTLMSGKVVDNIVVTDANDLVSITGAPNTDRRLLLIPASDKDVEGTAVAARIARAERDGIHARQSVRQRSPWWALPEPVYPDLIIPKVQHPRRVVATNAAQAAITDVAVGVVLHDTRVTDSLALWLNSTPGLFFDAVFRDKRRRADVTIRDAESFPIPTPEMLRDVHPARHRTFLRRPIGTVEFEWGTTEADATKLEAVRRDRRGADTWFMENMLGLSMEEQRWMLRVLLLSWQGHDVHRLLLAALEHDLADRHKIAPLAEWYTPALEQLPDTYKRVVLIPDGVRNAEVSRSMFAWQLTLARGTRTEEVIECASSEEAHIMRLFVELGKRHVEVPLDAPIIAELLPTLERFRLQLDAALTEVCTCIPDSAARDSVREALRARLVAM